MGLVCATWTGSRGPRVCFGSIRVVLAAAVAGSDIVLREREGRRIFGLLMVVHRERGTGATNVEEGLEQPTRTRETCRERVEGRGSGAWSSWPSRTRRVVVSNVRELDQDDAKAKRKLDAAFLWPSRWSFHDREEGQTWAVKF
nr:uncharacterized protein LOC117274773 [Nicotiana tomentosiformis]